MKRAAILALSLMTASPGVGCQPARRPPENPARLPAVPSEPVQGELPRTAPELSPAPQPPVASQPEVAPAEAARADEARSPEPAPQAPGPIGVGRAIELAEQFVRANGYTREFVPPDLEALVPESLEEFDRSDWLVSRQRNPLRPRAVGYLDHARNQADGWTIAFARVAPENPGRGRVVTMDARGGSIRVEHKELILDRVRPRP